MAEEPKDELKQESGEQFPAANETDALSQKLVELETNLVQVRDQLLRKAAEFENYKKRVENDYAKMVKFSNEELVTSLLPVLDDFHRSLKVKGTGAAPEAQNGGKSTRPTNDSQRTDNNQDFLRGIELIYNKLLKILQDEGIQQFEALGKPFDPSFHDALLQVPRNDVPPHTVVEEVEKGYTYHDKVIRHAKVIVSGEMPAADEASRVVGSPQGEKQNDRGGAE